MGDVITYTITFTNDGTDPCYKCSFY
ncbi:hypothetical protein ACT7CZ_17880 [Bacillus cereus]